jgi:hypothetical protein
MNVKPLRDLVLQLSREQPTGRKNTIVQRDIIFHKIVYEILAPHQSNLIVSSIQPTL